MKVWLTSGQVIMDGTDVVLCADCPCVDTTTDCDECPGGAPVDWVFTLAGVTDGGCSDCEELNIEWTVTHVADCDWASETFMTFCGAAMFGYVWRLRYSDPNWVLQLIEEPDLSVAVTYTLASEDWECMGPNVMNLDSEGTQCNDFPATVTLEAG